MKLVRVNRLLSQPSFGVGCRFNSGMKHIPKAVLIGDGEHFLLFPQSTLSHFYPYFTYICVT